MKSNKFFLSGILILVLQMFFFSSCNSQNQVTETYNPAKTTMTKDDSAVVLLDVRTPGEFSEGTVKGAMNIPLDELENRLKELDSKHKIVVFCKSGARSSRAIQILESHGFTNLVNGGSWADVAAKYGSTVK